MIKEKDLREMRQPIRFKDGRSVTFSAMQEAFSEKADEHGIPIAFMIDQIKSGGLIGGGTEDCLVLYHPEHQKDYFNIAIQIRYQGNYAFVTVSDFGKSTLLGNEGSKQHLKDTFKSGSGAEKAGALLGAGIRRLAKGGTNKQALQNEQMWYTIIIDIFDELDL